MNFWLGIDGALGGFSAACVGTDVTGVARVTRTEQTDGRDALEMGLILIERVLGDTDLYRLEGIAVVTGPGSFTGLRIALSYAKSLALSARLPIVPVSSYDAYEPPDAKAPCAAFVHGRAGVGCVRLRLPRETWVGCGQYATLADAAASRTSVTELRAYGAAKDADAAFGERGIIVRLQPPFAQTPALGAVLRALGGARRCDPHSVDADYGEAHYAERPNGRAL